MEVDSKISQNEKIPHKAHQLTSYSKSDPDQH